MARTTQSASGQNIPKAGLLQQYRSSGHTWAWRSQFCTDPPPLSQLCPPLTRMCDPTILHFIYLFISWSSKCLILLQKPYVKTNNQYISFAHCFYIDLANQIVHEYYISYQQDWRYREKTTEFNSIFSNEEKIMFR